MMIKVKKYFTDKRVSFAVLTIIIISVTLYAINLKLKKPIDKYPSNTHEQVIEKTAISALQSNSHSAKETNKNLSHHSNAQQPNALLQQNSYSAYACAQLDTFTQTINNEEAFKQLAEQCAQQLTALLHTEKNTQAITTLIKNLLRHWEKVDDVAAFKWLQQQNHLLMATNIAQFQALLIPQLTIQHPYYAWSTFEYILTENNRQLLLNSLAQHWIQNDESTALSWLENLELSSPSPVTLTEREYHDVYEIAIYELSKIAPHLAFEEIFRIKKASIRESLLQNMIDVAMRDNAELTINIITQIEDESLRTNSMLYLINRYNNDKTTDVLDYLLDNAHKFDTTLIINAFSQLSEIAPNIVSGKVSQLPEALKQPMVETLLSNWLYKNENDAVYWLNNHSSAQYYDAGVSVVAKHFLLEQPLIAFDWANKIENTEKRFNLLQNLVDFSVHDDPEQFINIIDQAPLNTEEKEQLINRYKTNIN